MADTRQGEQPEIDTDKLTGIMTDVAGQCQGMLQQLLERPLNVTGAAIDPMGIGQAFLALASNLAKNPGKALEVQAQAWTAYANLWLNTAKTLLGETGSPVRPSDGGDRRFRHAAWDDNLFYSFVRQSYLIAADAVQDTLRDTEGMDEQSARKARFYARQFVDALSPTNFPLTNPEVMEATLESKGENLLRGIRNFIEDFDAESGRLRITMTDRNAFQPGRDIAVSPGKVVFQNDLFQLLQFAPTTDQSFSRPLLIIPPWINKYYVLDLQPENSMIRWLTAQGHTVFVISWVNPDAKLAHKDFPDYVQEGALTAVDAVQKITGEASINVVGYCIGGTLLAAMLACMQATADKRVASATFFVSLIDFSIPGDLGVFIDEQQLENIEQTMNEQGYHDGKDMATTFNMLRANDLIWSFYVHNYLLGKDPLPFDLLYWNADSTRLPAAMQSTYLRTMYLKNEFRKPGGLNVAGVPIDVSSIQVPAYFISAEDDHIAPWEGTYLGAQLLSGPVRFVLGKSGHIAGIINPPAANKYGYYTGSDMNIAAAEWRAGAEAHPGSWWPDWQNWLEQYAGEKIPARHPGSNGQSVLEDAPGSYVRVRF